MLLVQKYLREGNSLEDLRLNHGVRSSETNNKICLNYHQLEAKDSDVLSQQCRGLVLRKNTFDIVACPLFRFFNLEQENVAAPIDWNSSKYYNKLDGTNIIVYYDFVDKSWHCGTRNRCEADAPAHDSDITFRKLVDETVSQMGSSSDDLQALMYKADKDFTYIFELTTPLNRIVCKYDDFSLALLAVRNNKTLKEYHHCDFIDSFNIKPKIPEEFQFNTTEQMIKAVREWSPEDYEGVVVVDKNFNRVKVKSLAYISYNHMRDSLQTSYRGCMEVILSKKDDDVIHMMPDVIANRIRKLKPVISEVIRTAESDYNRLKHIDDMKEFALQAKDCLWPAILFSLKRGKVDSIDSFIFDKESVKIATPVIDNLLSLCEKIDKDILKD